MRISGWSSDVCSSDLPAVLGLEAEMEGLAGSAQARQHGAPDRRRAGHDGDRGGLRQRHVVSDGADVGADLELEAGLAEGLQLHAGRPLRGVAEDDGRTEEHTSELQSLMRISYAVFCLKKK